MAKKRIRHLVEEGSNFSVAKSQAEVDVQSLFDIINTSWDLSHFDQMSISSSGDDNAFLLLCSAIIQNIFTSTPEFSEYIEKLAQDLSDNGVVDDNSLTDLINASAMEIELTGARNNLQERYGRLGETLDILNFKNLINRAPITNAGIDLTGLVDIAVVLDGSMSMDLDSDTLTYTWTLIDAQLVV